MLMSMARRPPRGQYTMNWQKYGLKKSLARSGNLTIKPWIIRRRHIGLFTNLDEHLPILL